MSYGQALSGADLRGQALGVKPILRLRNGIWAFWLGNRSVPILADRSNQRAYWFAAERAHFHCKAWGIK